jgi:hypothetical protein
MNQGVLCSTFQEIREVAIDDFPVSAKQQFFDLDRRLLGVPHRPVGVCNQTSVHTEGQRQTQTAGHLERPGSGLHDGGNAGAGTDL